MYCTYVAPLVSATNSTLGSCLQPRGDTDKLTLLTVGSAWGEGRLEEGAEGGGVAGAGGKRGG
jgi:hypothetical protein